MTAQQLKNSILQMAVQGKLVPQNPNVEPASVLLERIRSEKEELVKEGKIKKEKNPSVIFRGDDNLFYEKVGKQTPVCIEDDLPFEIPESWEWVRFASVIELQSGQDMAPDKYNTESKGMPYITGASNIESEAVIINRWTEYGKTYAYNGDILLTCKGTVGKMAILNEPKVHIARQIMAIRPSSLLNVKYIMMVLDSMVAILNAAAKSMIPGISREDILSSIVPLPPRLEQDRICEKYESTKPLLKDYFSNQALLEHLNTTFPDQLKKSILQMAVQGKLVPQDPNDEPAFVLLKRIRAEKDEMIKEGRIKKEKNPSVIFRGADNLFYEKVGNQEPICIADEIPFEIPESWEWVRHNELFEISGGSQPSKSKFLNEQKDGYVRLYQIRDYGENPIPTYIPQNTATKFTEEGDLLLARYGASVGKVFYAHKGAYNVAMAKVIPLFLKTDINLNYLFYYYNSSLYQKLVKNNSRSAQAGFNKDDLKTLLFPVPPLKEQERIVARLSSLLWIIDSIKAS